MTQSELGKRLQISRSAIGLYETERRRPDLETLLRIAETFDVSIDWLLDRKTTGLHGRLAEVTQSLSNTSLSELEQYAEYLRFMEAQVHNAKQLANLRNRGSHTPSLRNTEQRLQDIFNPRSD